MTFDTLLVANRGEIARRIMRSAHDMGMRCVAVYVDADCDAPFVHEADEAIRLTTTYLDGAAIIDAAKLTGAQAIHPGYGFLSENAEFAQSVLDAHLVWVGPSPHVIASMGDKLAAKRLAIESSVPTLGYSDDPAQADTVGYPVLIKAAAGGGGKGMRIVSHPDELDDAVHAARREALHAFGNDTIFLEHYVENSRHIEIQILGDQHGHLVHLGERECSIQRRHQKLVEESPSPVLSSEIREAMGRAALSLAKAMGYSSAGTVEFLVDDATKEFFFLEVNTRLQVEHPVTEEVTGLDLVREQLRVARGETLGFTQDDVTFSGHAIEVRLCAEDPESGFLPATGTLVAFEPTNQSKVRWESGVVQGSVVGVSFDPMLAKVIAHGRTRNEAAARLALALEQLHLGGVVTNRDLLANTLRHPGFLAGDTTTNFIDRVQPKLFLHVSPDEVTYAARAAALWMQAQNRASAELWPSAPSGWRNSRLPNQHVQLRHRDDLVDVHYQSQRDGTFHCGDARARILHADDTCIDLEIDNRRSCPRVTRSGAHIYVQVARGTLAFEIVPRFVVPGLAAPVGGLNAPMPGTVLAVHVEVGDVVTKGTTLLILEAMKMEHSISAPFDGQVVDILVNVGQQVENGAALLVIDELALDGPVDGG